MKRILLACNTISDEVLLAVEKVGFPFPIRWIESGLHIDPNSLRDRIQQELDSISEAEEVLLAFGACGNALQGITSKNSRIIVPKVDDCITLLLGSAKRRKEENQKGGTYFLTKGWLQHENNIWNDYKRCLAQYGEARTERIYKEMLAHYERLGIIETGAYSVEEFEDTAKQVALDLKLCKVRIPGTVSYLEKLLCGPWDQDFLVVEPGKAITFTDFLT